uniref:Uncharacterized protein n=1 Tax=Cannabis sativa TaxID=3483 RepID=A0A803QZ13_CANSA
MFDEFETMKMRYYDHNQLLKFHLQKHLLLFLRSLLVLNLCNFLMMMTTPYPLLYIPLYIYIYIYDALLSFSLDRIMISLVLIYHNL